MDKHDIERAINYPERLIQRGYLDGIEKVRASDRELVTDILLDCITPVEDLSQFIYFLNKVLSNNPEIGSLLIKTQRNQDTLMPHEMQQLLNFLVPLSDK